MIHTASLIHDDVIDDSGMRRGTYVAMYKRISNRSIEKRSLLFIHPDEMVQSAIWNPYSRAIHQLNGNNFFLF
jgi:geranylgeranyl pyrophosphate synthase